MKNGVAFQCITIDGLIECTFFNERQDTALAQVPTLSELGLATIAVLMLMSGVYVFYSKRKMAI